MPNLICRPTLRFGPYEADFRLGELRKYGLRLKVQAKPMAVLAALTENPGEIVSRDALRAALWDCNTFVDFDRNLSTAVNKLREALCDSVEKPRYIETIPRRGYRFLVPVQRTDILSLDQSPPPDQQTQLELSPLQFEPPALLDPRNFILKLWKPVSAGMLVLLVCLIAFDQKWPIRRGYSSNTNASPTVAVLPFTDGSPERKQEYLADGISDEVITQLGRIPGLRVIGRNSSFQFKQLDVDHRKIAKQLGVAYLVDGSVLKVGEGLRIQAHLVKASDGFQLWTESYDIKTGDVLRVQDDIAKSVASALSSKLLVNSSTSRVPHVPNPEAYQAYLQARYFKGRWIVSELKTSLRFLDRSLHIDPEYAPAWALRSSVFTSMGDMGVMKKDEALQRARQDAQRSIALDPSLAEGYVALATSQMNEWDWEGAEETLKKASDAFPNDTGVLIARSQLYRALGDTNECIQTLKRVTLLDPLSSSAFGMLGNRLFYAGRYEEALSAQQRALELNPDAEFVRLNRAQVYLKLERPNEALNELNSEPGAFWKTLGEVLVYYDLGRKKESDVALRKLIAEHKLDQAYTIAQVYAQRGEAKTAFEWLGRAVTQHDSSLMDAKIDPFLDSLRRDDRYILVLKKIGLSQAHGADQKLALAR